MKVLKLIFITICVGLATANSKFSPLKSRIIGGNNATKGQFPYQVSIRLRSIREHVCGASILSNRFMLTAAHCLEYPHSIPESVYAVVGALHLNGGGVTVYLDKITPHDDYDSKTLINDICLVRSAKEIIFSDSVQPIALPTHNLPKEGNIQTILSGFGRNSSSSDDMSNNLQFTEPRTISNTNCVERFKKHPLVFFAKRIRETLICTMNGNAPVLDENISNRVGACHGDSGGPLVMGTDPVNRVLIGIVSWTVPCAKGYPDVFTRVYSYLDWIQTQMEEQSNFIE